MSSKKVGVLGSGQVGQVLATGLIEHGHEVMIGTRDPSKLDEWRAAQPAGRVGSVEEAARFGEIVVLAVAGRAAEAVVRAVGEESLAGKTVIDATNPIADKPPEGGVLSFFTTLDESLMERLQRVAPRARFVKAFSSVGNALMVDPKLPGGPPTMFICGDDDGAKAEVAGILEQFGWGAEDMGGAPAARAIEPLCILWCIPGLTRNEWTHAFKLLKA